jgi:signal transduction histidine kinase
VEDSGEGIAPDRLLPIFEPFEQADGDVSMSMAGLDWACRSAGASRGRWAET